MKLLYTALSFFLVGYATAQHVAIGHPPDRTAATKGSKVVVQVDRPNTLSGSTEVAVVIGLNSCHNTACPPAGAIMGSILYNGKYSPELHSGSLPPYENFTVTIPTSFEKGPAQLTVFHAALIGAGPEPFQEDQVFYRFGRTSHT